MIATPVERGTRVAAGRGPRPHLGTEADAQLREAEANAAQIEARLGLSAGQPFDPMRVPDVMNAKASLDWAEAEFDRIKSLLDQKVVSQSEYDQRRTQVEAARQQYQVAQNGAQQSYRSLQARARARRARAQGRRPTPSSARRSPASSPSGSSASATTSRAARRSPRSCGSIRCASS